MVLVFWSRHANRLELELNRRTPAGRNAANRVGRLSVDVGWLIASRVMMRPFGHGTASVWNPASAAPRSLSRPVTGAVRAAVSVAGAG